MLGVSEQQLRGWQRHGLIADAPTYSFTDLIALRTLQKLREHRIPSRKIGRALVSLKQKLSGIQRPLSELKIVSDGRNIAVQIAGQRMEAISGQLLFDFDTAELSTLKAFPKDRPSRRLNSEKEAEFWFQKGLELEESEAKLVEAIEAYKKAVELNPNAAGALVNLGTIYYRLLHFADAERYYRRAIQADPSYPLAHFNLGNLFDEQGDLEQAEKYYTSALRLSPAYADAHFNLALMCERSGDAMRAVRHWKAYLKLDSSSSWAGVARKQLEKLCEATLIKPRV